MSINRREFSESLIGSIASYSLLRALFTTDEFADSVEPVTADWLKGLHEMRLDLQVREDHAGQWQTKIAALFDRVSLEELLARIDFARLVQGFEYPDLGVNMNWVKFPRLDGVPE